MALSGYGLDGIVLEIFRDISAILNDVSAPNCECESAQCVKQMKDKFRDLTHGDIDAIRIPNINDSVSQSLEDEIGPLINRTKESDLENKFALAESEIQRLKSAEAELRNEIQHLEREKTEYQSENSRLRNERHNSDLSQSNEWNTDLKMDNLRQRVKSQSDSITNLSKENRRLESTNKDSQSRIQFFISIGEQNESQISQLKHKLQSIKKENHNNHITIQSQTKQLNQMYRIIESMQCSHSESNDAIGAHYDDDDIDGDDDDIKDSRNGIDLHSSPIVQLLQLYNHSLQQKCISAQKETYYHLIIVCAVVFSVGLTASIFLELLYPVKLCD